MKTFEMKYEELKVIIKNYFDLINKEKNLEIKLSEESIKDLAFCGYAYSAFEWKTKLFINDIIKIENSILITNINIQSNPETKKIKKMEILMLESFFLSLVLDSKNTKIENWQSNLNQFIKNITPWKNASVNEKITDKIYNFFSNENNNFYELFPISKNNKGLENVHV